VKGGVSLESEVFWNNLIDLLISSSEKALLKSPGIGNRLVFLSLGLHVSTRTQLMRRSGPGSVRDESTFRPHLGSECDIALWSSEEGGGRHLCGVVLNRYSESSRNASVW